jgi:hypothetical protein
VSADIDVLTHYAAKSRGVVIFRSYKCLVWESDDGYAVIAWAKSFDTPKNATAQAEGGFFHAVVYTVNTGFVSYETEH